METQVESVQKIYEHQSPFEMISKFLHHWFLGENTNGFAMVQATLVDTDGCDKDRIWHHGVQKQILLTHSLEQTLFQSYIFCLKIQLWKNLKKKLIWLYPFLLVQTVKFTPIYYWVGFGQYYIFTPLYWVRFFGKLHFYPFVLGQSK